MTEEILEPFLILPYGTMQDVVWFINEHIKNKYSFLIDMAYKKISNEIFQSNLIRVVNRFHEIIIFHIYPTSYEEKFSGRRGQYLIVGYIINKKSFLGKYDNLLCACNLFFRSIILCGSFDASKSIPTQFLYKINSEYYNEYISGYLTQTRDQMLLIMKNKDHIDTMEQNERLKKVYDFIKRKRFFFKEYWIVVDSKEFNDYKRNHRIYSLTLKE